MSFDKNSSPCIIWSKDIKKSNGIKTGPKPIYNKNESTVPIYKNNKVYPSPRNFNLHNSKDSKWSYEVFPESGSFEEGSQLNQLQNKGLENAKILKQLGKKEKQKYAFDRFADTKFEPSDFKFSKSSKNNCKKWIPRYSNTERCAKDQVNRQYDKQQFLLANCQFVILQEDIHSFIKNAFIDPDFIIEWNNVQQVILWCEEIPICPICLDQPVPAKLTKCGHMYCWPCILHYLDLSDKYWRRCPICFEAIKKEDLKSASVKRFKKSFPGASISFSLMQRCKNSIICAPAKFGCGDEFDPLTRCDPSMFNKILTVSLEYVSKSIITREEEQLILLADDPENATEIAYITEALSILKIGCSSINAKLATMPGTECINSTTNPLTPTYQNPSSNNDVFYFYQSSDGQALYLHPCNVRMLLDQRDGEWDKCPRQLIAAPILEIESHLQTLDSRKRFHFLSHLPLYKEYAFVEISMGSTRDEHDKPVISEDIIDKFSEMLRDRVTNRAAASKKLEREEFRNQRRILESGADPYACFQSRLSNAKESINLDSETDFPSANLPCTSRGDTHTKLDTGKSNENTCFTSFAQLLHNVPNGAWRDLTKREKNLEVGPSTSLAQNNFSDDISSDQDVEADPELSMYLWKSHNLQQSYSPQNLLKFIDNEPKSLTPSCNKKKKKRNFIRVEL